MRSALAILNQLLVDNCKTVAVDASLIPPVKLAILVAMTAPARANPVGTASVIRAYQGLWVVGGGRDG